MASTPRTTEAESPHRSAGAGTYGYIPVLASVPVAIKHVFFEAGVTVLRQVQGSQDAVMVPARIYLMALLSPPADIIELKIHSGEVIRKDINLLSYPSHVGSSVKIHYSDWPGADLRSERIDFALVETARTFCQMIEDRIKLAEYHHHSSPTSPASNMEVTGNKTTKQPSLEAEPDAPYFQDSGNETSSVESSLMVQPQPQAAALESDGITSRSSTGGGSINPDQRRSSLSNRVHVLETTSEATVSKQPGTRHPSLH